ncbi:hypothetical protein ABPG75_002489 [Micractinium tetrahymenae]
MHVPRDTFKSGRSPEEQAAHTISLMCTAVAVRVVLAQLGGGGEGGDLPPTPDFQRLRDFLAARPLTSGSGEEWLAELMAQHPLLGVRVLEVRGAYCASQLDWQAVRQLTQRRISDSNAVVAPERGRRRADPRVATARAAAEQLLLAAALVTDHLAEDEQEAARLEARLRVIASSPKLDHPNLVKVLHCAVERPALADAADSGACFDCSGEGEVEDFYDEESGSWREDSSPGWPAIQRRRHLQVWTMSELCGQGTLETAVARGWLRKGSSALGKAEAEPDLWAILSTAQEIAAALAHLHAHGFAHNELSSARVLLSHASGERPFTAKLTSACQLACHKALPRKQQTLRLDTAACTAPEVLLGAATEHSPASNVYAFGVLLYEMYSGQLVWDTLHGSQIVCDMLAGKPVLPPLVGCPPAYQALVTACTAHRAADRPALQSVLASLSLLQESLA